MPQDEIDDYLKRYAQKRVREEAQKQGVPADYIERQARAESAFDPNVVTGKRRSSAGAIGTMQLMPGTAKDLKVDPYHIDQNIEGGVRYSKQMLDKYGGDRNKASAAYNWGPGNVDKKGLANAPQETRDYQRKVAGDGDDIDEFLGRWKEPPTKPSPSPQGTDTDASGRETGAGMSINKPAGVAPKPRVVDPRARQAAQITRKINEQRNEATRLFQQADKTPGFAVDGGLNPGQQLRAQAEGKLEQANMLAKSAQQSHGDLLEIGFGKDTDPNSKRQWAYAKPKALKAKEEADAMAIQAGNNRRFADPNGLNQSLNVTPEAKARFDHQRKIEGIQRSSYPGTDPVARFGSRVWQAINGESAADMAEAYPPAIPGEEDINRIAQSGVKGAGQLVRGGATALPYAFPVVDMMSKGLTGKPLRAYTEGLGRPMESAISRGAEAVLPENPANQSFLAKTERGAGSMIPAIGGALATGGGSLAAGALGALTNLGRVADERDQSKVPISDFRRVSSDALAIATGMTEALGMGKLLNRVGLSTPLAHRLAQMIEEGGQEYAQDYLNDINAKLVAAYDPQRQINDPLAAKRLEAAAIGAILGAGGEVADYAGGKVNDRITTSAIRAESAPMQGVRPTTIGPTQITPLSRTTAAAQPATTIPAIDPTVTSTPIKPEPSSVNPPVAAESQSSAFPRLPARELTEENALLQFLGGKEPVENRINKIIDSAEGLLKSPRENDQKRVNTVLKRALAQIQTSEGYQAELGLPDDAPKPYTAVVDAIEARLKPVAKQAKAEPVAPDAANSPTAELPTPQPANTGQRLIEQTRQKADTAIEEGRYGDALLELKAHQQALKDAKTAARKSPGLRVQLERQIGQVGNRIGEVRKMDREARKQANAPTKPVTFSQAETPQVQSTQPISGNKNVNISAPLLRPESVQNPEGGIPQMPEQTFSGRLDQGIRKDAAEQAKPQRVKADTNLSPIEYLKRKTGRQGFRISDKGEARRLGSKEAGIVGLTNKNSKWSTDDARVMLDEHGGFRMPDGRAFTDDSVTENDVLTYLDDFGKQQPMNTGNLEQRLKDEEAEYYAQQEGRSSLVGDLKSVVDERGAFTRGTSVVRQMLEGRSTNELVDALKWTRGKDATSFVERFGGTEIAAELRSRGVPVDEIKWQVKTLGSQSEPTKSFDQIDEEVQAEFKPDTADLREVREFGKREAEDPGYTEEPPTAPLARMKNQPTVRDILRGKKGEFGKVSAFARQGEGLSAQSELRKALGLKPMPAYHLPDADINPRTGKPFTNPEWGKAAQETMDALSDLAGIPRSSRMGIDGLRKAYAALQKKGKIAPEVRNAFIDTAERYTNFVERVQTMLDEDSTIADVINEVQSTYERGQELTASQDSRLKEAVKSAAEAYGINQNYSVKSLWQAIKDTKAEYPQASGRTEPTRIREDVPVERVEAKPQESAPIKTGDSVTWKRGDKVEWDVRGITRSGTVKSVQGDNAVIEIGYDMTETVPVSKLVAVEVTKPKIREQKARSDDAISEAKIQFKSGKRGQAGTLYANDMALHIIRSAYEMSHGEQAFFANVNMNKSAARKIAAALTAEAQSGNWPADMQRSLRRTAREFNHAAQSGETVSIVQTGSGRGFGDIKISRRHELFHDAQEGLQNSKGFLTRHEHGQKVIDSLAELGYEPEDRTVEAAAFVASGETGRLGLTDEQGKAFLKDYFDDIVANNGREALERFVSLSPKVQGALKEARAKYDVQGKTGKVAEGKSEPTKAGRLGANGEAARSGERVPERVREQKRSSFGELENEPTGEVLGVGLGGLQKMLGRTPKVETPEAVPDDWDVNKFIGKISKQLLPQKAKDGSTKPPAMKLTGEQSKEVMAGIKRMMAGAKNEDFVEIFKAREDVRKAMFPELKRDVKWFDNLQSRLSNVNFRGTYERIAGKEGKEISEIFRNAQVDTANNKITRGQAVVRLRKELRPYIQRLKLGGKPGLARWVETHIDAISDPDQSFKGLAGFLKGFNFYTLLAYNPRSAFVNKLQPLQTLWPHVTSREYLKLLNQARDPKIRERVLEIAKKESGGNTERPEDKKQIWTLFSRVSDSNRVLGHLAGEMFADRQGLTGDAKARMAADWAKKVEFDTSQYDVPPLFAKPLASVLGQFKSFQIKNLERLYADWKSAAPETLASGAGPNAGKIARRAKMIAGQVAIGGVRSAVPGLKHIGGVLLLGALAKGLSNFFDDDKAEKIAEVVYFGLPGLIDQDLSGSVMLFDEPFGKTPYEQAVNFFLGPSVSRAVALYDEGKDYYNAEDSKETTKEEKRERSALKIAKTITPLTKTGQFLYAASQGKTPNMWLGKEEPMNIKEAVGYGLGGTPLRQTKFYAHKEAADWQKKMMPNRFPADDAKSKKTRVTESGDIESTIPKKKPGEPDAVYEQRKGRVEGWMETYGQQLIDNPRYKALPEDQQKMAIESLRRRIGIQQNAIRPNEKSFAPNAILLGVQKSVRERPKRQAKNLWNAPAR